METRLEYCSEDGTKLATIRRKIDTDGFVITFFVDGERQTDADYFTADKQDAINIAKRFISEPVRSAFQKEYENLAHSFCPSFWLKESVNVLMGRDPLDALRDAKQLHRLMKIRWEAMTRKRSNNG
jgi:hypothetical protein